MKGNPHFFAVNHRVSLLGGPRRDWQCLVLRVLFTVESGWIRIAAIVRFPANLPTYGSPYGGGLYVGGYFLLLGRDLQKSHLPHSAPQARSDAVTDLELSFIWLLWGWQAKDCTFHEVHYSSTE